MSDALPQTPLNTLPANETERLAALHRYRILDTPPEVAFDRITRLAARLFNMPTVLISLVDESRAWFKSGIGFAAREVPRATTLCSFSVLAKEPLIIPDTRLDERFACNPLVQSELGVRFYAGAPLLSHDGFNLGTLCLIDSQPRKALSIEQQATLVDLAAMVVDELELRWAVHKIAQVDAALIEITKGVGAVTGRAFFDALTQHFAKILDVDYVYISLVEGDAPKRLKTIATCAHGQIVDNLEYLLQDTPCWEVIEQQKICCYPHNVQAQFPNAPLLKPLAVESYIAAPLLNNGTSIGLVGVMDGKPLENIHLAESLLTIFSNRIVAELERQQAEVALRQSEEKYRSLFESIDEGFCICEMLFDENDKPCNYRFLEVNSVFEKLTGLEQATGRTMQELAPTLEAVWFEIYGKVVQTGESVRFEQQSVVMNRWFDVNAFRIGEPQSHQFAILFTNISDRKQAEQERERFLDLGSDLQVIIDHNGYFQWVSPTFERVLGWTFAEMIGHPWTKFVHLDDISTSVSEVTSLFSGKETYKFENRYLHKDGSYRWFLWKAQAYPEEQVIYGAAVDITERKQVEAALQEAHVQLESALAAGSVYTWRWNIPTDRIVVNAAFAQLFDVDPVAATTEGLPIKFFTNSVHEEDRPLVLAAIQQAIATGQEYMAEYRVYTATGEERWLTARGQVEYDATGKPLALPGALADITERKRAEEERDRFFQISQDMLVIASMDGYFLQANPAWTKTLGYSMEELTAQPYIEFVHQDDRAATLAQSQLLAQSLRIIEFENRYRTQDGSYRWISWSVVPFIEQELLYCVARDVSDRKLAEAERERLLISERAAREEAEAANRLKDEFLAVLSHELRSPLNPILGWSRLLQNGKLDQARQTEALKTIERNAKLQSQLIEDLLDISRIMQGKLTLTAAPVSLRFVILAALETVRLAAEAKNVQILLDLDSTIAPVSGDASRLQQVVWNLLTNAVKFTPQGRQVTVELRQVNQLAQIRVIDTGKGINPEFLPYVFEYFRQEDGSTTRKFGGLGLGLAIVRQIVEMHGGRVTAESTGENQGAIFTVQLPGIQQENPAPAEPIRTSVDSENLLSNLQILIVDDDNDTREFQTFVLEQSGATVTAVASGVEALQVLERFIPDLLVSDVGMAEMDGYMLIQEIRGRPIDQGGQIRAIALTAYAAEIDQQKSLQAGFLAHLTKPVDPDQLVSMVMDLFKRS